MTATYRNFNVYFCKALIGKDNKKLSDYAKILFSYQNTYPIRTFEHNEYVMKTLNKKGEVWYGNFAKVKKETSSLYDIR